MSVEVTVDQYLESRTTLCARIAAIDAIITSALTKMAAYVSSGEFITEEAWLDDGMMKTRVNFRSAEETTKMITEMRKLKNMFKGDLNGRSTRLLSGNNCY